MACFLFRIRVPIELYDFVSRFFLIFSRLFRCDYVKIKKLFQGPILNQVRGIIGLRVSRLLLHKCRLLHFTLFSQYWCNSLELVWRPTVLKYILPIATDFRSSQPVIPSNLAYSVVMWVIGAFGKHLGWLRIFETKWGEHDSTTNCPSTKRKVYIVIDRRLLQFGSGPRKVSELVWGLLRQMMLCTYVECEEEICRRTAE